MSSYPESLKSLIEEFAHFPGIGRKTAERMAFHLLKADNKTIDRLSDALRDVKDKVSYCTVCGGMSEKEACNICTDIRRDENLLCIVESSSNIHPFERTNSYKGKYHVLGGCLSPLDGIGPDELSIDRLIERVQPGMEIIIATNPSVEGETTALYLSKLFSGQNDVTVTRLARGIPVGGNLEYVDEPTLIRAMEGRTSI